MGSIRVLGSQQLGFMLMRPFLCPTDYSVVFQMELEPLLDRKEMEALLMGAAGAGCVGMWKAVTEASTKLCKQPLSELVGPCEVLYGVS